MTKETAFFIQILSDHIARKKTELTDVISWAEIARMAHVHQVEGIVYYQCQEIIPLPYKKQFEKYYVLTAYSYTNRKATVNEVLEAFNDSGILAIQVKGLKVAEYYPVPFLRTMGDCDIVVAPEQMQSAIQIMRAQGFTGRDSVDVHEWCCKRNEIHFEVHDELLHHSASLLKEHQAFFNDFAPYIQGFEFDWNFHFLYLLAHLRQHFMNRGVGFRQFIDLAVIIQNGPKLRWKWITAKLRQLNLLSFAQVCFTLLNTWFGIAVPINCKVVQVAFINQITDIICKNGVFGYENTENMSSSVSTTLILSRKPMWINRLIIFRKNIFLPYQDMRGYPGCEYIINRPYLLPLAWVHRIVNLIKENGFLGSINTIKIYFISKKAIAQRRQILRKMGLI